MFDLFPQNYCLESNIVVSMKKGVGKFPCIGSYAKSFFKLKIVMALGIVIFFLFFFEFFDFSRTLTFKSWIFWLFSNTNIQIWDLGFNQNNELSEIFLHKWLRSVF